MSKTGGGRGTNQYQIHGVGKGVTGRQEPILNLRPTSAASGGPDWEALLAKYPTYPGDYQAVPEPRWDDLSETLPRVHPKGRDRAIGRYVLRESRTIYNDSRLEGFAFTEPEITTLINGGHIAGHTAGEEAQVNGMKAASDYMLNRVREATALEPEQAISDGIHLFIGAPLGLKSIAFRGDQKEQYQGPRVSLGGGEEFRALDARLTHIVLDEGLARIGQIDHPVARAATWAAFATYQQFYLDGNKRTGRYVMNAVLMSHGYEAILIPGRLKSQYENALVDSYRTGDLTPHLRFLLDLYSDD